MAPTQRPRVHVQTWNLLSWTFCFSVHCISARATAPGGTLSFASQLAGIPADERASLCPTKHAFTYTS